MDKLYIGIDPGMSGGFAVITPDGVSKAFKMPKTEHDINRLIAHLTSFDCERHVYLEAVGVMPGNGAVSMFKFGKGYGFLRGCLIANKIPFEDVRPQKWQKGLGVVPRNKKKGETKTEFKNRLKAMAQQKHPELKITLATADAILICEYSKLMNR